MEHFLAPTLRSGQEVVVDDLGDHEGERVRELIEEGASCLTCRPTRRTSTL